MATLDLQGTKLSFRILPSKKEGGYVETEISVENDYFSYHNQATDFTLDEMQEWIFSMNRLLAGAYGKEYNLSFDKAGIAVDFYPYMEEGRFIERAERREKDCVMMLRLLLKSKNGKAFLGGVHSFLFHKKEIVILAQNLREEFDENYAQRVHGTGKHLFVGVSPQGYKGCNYWYLDPSDSTVAGEYVWVRMGRHNTEQVVYVDSVKRFDDDNAPYDPATVKQVLRKASKQEIKDFLKSVKK